MKKIMMLGGNFFQVSAIKRAKELGYYVISVDYLPDNPGHKYSDEYYNVSTTDKEAVLKLASELKIDGILSYASDVSVPTAAYVAEKLGLPTNPYESVMILTHKHLFRQFLEKNQFHTPAGKAFQDKNSARQYVMQSEFPIVIKPVDASGSKGVSKVADQEEFARAYDEASSYSASKMVIIEKFINRSGYQIDGDGFICDGKIIFFGVMDQHKNVSRNPYAPIGHSYPSVQDYKYQKKAFEQIQAIFDQLNMKFGAFNFEYLVGEDDQIHILEIGPRNGGNYIEDTIRYALGVDMIGASVSACVGDKFLDFFKVQWNRTASSYVIHALKTGRFKALYLHDGIKEHIVYQKLFVAAGDRVNAFRNGGDCIGIMIIQFEDTAQMNHMMDKMWEYVEVIVE